jgi:hypothetical protein
MKYMMLIYVDPTKMQEPEPGEIDAHLALTREAIGRGAYVTCDALESASNATSVRVRDGHTIVADGPFAETKEVLGGFYVFDCKDRDEAIELAARIPPARHGTIEIRAVAEIPGWDDAVADIRRDLAAESAPAR